MKISEEGRPQPNARTGFGFAPLWSAQDFARRDPLEIVLARNKLGTSAQVFVASCAGRRGSQ
jgi:hypothetical protein